MTRPLGISLLALAGLLAGCSSSAPGSIAPTAVTLKGSVT